MASAMAECSTVAAIVWCSCDVVAIEGACRHFMYGPMLVAGS